MKTKPYVPTGLTLKSLGIPMLTGDGNYVVDIPFDHIPDNIARYQGSDEDVKSEIARLDLNPDFQRGHVWTQAQQVAFIEFLLRGGKSGNLNFNCNGWMQSWEGPFVIVDGLQRLTAILSFHKEEIKAFGHTYNEFDKSIFRCISVKLCINNLKTREEVLKWYLEINGAGTPHTKEELDRVRKMLR